MLEAASLLSLFLAFALLHGAAPGRFPLKPARASRSVLTCLKVGSLAAAAGGITLWSRAENTTSACLVALAALSTAATVFVLLAPLFPRAVWVSVVACPPIIVGLVLMGGSHG